MSDSSERSRPGILRMLGLGALGLIGGALLALFVQDLLATVFVRNGHVPAALIIVFTYLIPVVAVVSAVVAVLVDRRLNARRRARSDRAWNDDS